MTETEADKGVLRRAASAYTANLVHSIRLPEVANRDFQLDAIKGFAIVLVVLGHTFQMYFAEGNDAFWGHVVYSFHMPLFFFVSGYLAYSSMRHYSGGELIGKRFVNLVVPFLSWYFIFGAIETLMFRDKGFPRYTWAIVNNPVFGRWFLMVLFLCFVALAVAVYLERYMKEYAFLVVLVAVAIPAMIPTGKTITFLGVASLQGFLIFFFAGYLLRRHRDVLNGWLARQGSRGRKLLVAACAVYPVLVLVALLIGQSPSRVLRVYRVTWPGQFTWPHLEGLVVAAFAILTVWIAFRMKRTRRGVGWLAWLGNYSLDIYVIHIAGTYYLLRVMSKPLQTAGPVGRLFMILLITTCGILFSLFVSFFLLRQNRFLAFLFLGKPLKKKAKVKEAVDAAGGAMPVVGLRPGSERAG